MELEAACPPGDSVSTRRTSRLGGGVNGGGESRGTGADNDEVAELRGVNVGVEPEAIGEFLNCGIAEDRALAADYDGNFVKLDVEAIEELL